MPCNSDMGSYNPDDFARNEIKKMKEELDSVTRLLCGIMRVISATNPPVASLLLENANLQKWWDRHQEHDRREGRS